MAITSPARSAARPRRGLVVLAALATLIAVAAGLVALRAAVPQGCSSGSPAVAVAADPAIAPTLTTALGPEQTADGACVRLRVTAQRPADVARDVAAGQGPQLWIPDSASSAQLALPPRGGAAPTTETGPSLARSPLVAVTDPDAAARAGWTRTPPTWRALLGGTLPVSIADPTTTGEGLLALLSATATLGVIDPAAPPVDVINGLVRLGRTQFDDPQEGFRDPAAAAAFVATEQAALAGAPGRPLAVAYPAEGSIALDYPMIRVRRPAESPDLDPAVDAVDTALRSDAVRQALQDAGFRDPQGRLADRLPDTAPAGASIAAPAALPVPPQVLAQQALWLWTTVNTAVRLLSVIDVSGSMADAAGPVQTRIELARDAGLTGLALFSEDSASGLWVFSRELTPTTDWRELSPLADLAAPDGGGTHREAVQRAAGEMTRLVGGGTALYDTTLAATREVRRGHRPDLINAVALFTDGRNEDPVGIDQEALVATLRAEASPARPVPVFAIGIGPDADLAELTAIAEATGGQAYLARTPDEIRRVFFDALARWTCRGAC